SCDIANHLSVEVTDEHTADGKEFSKLSAMDTVGKVNKVFGDSAYDSRDNFNSAMGAEPVIKPNFTGKSKGSYVRSKVVREFLNDPTAWKHRYGQMWKRCSLR
ncbi:MAG: hypothetical protein QXL00_04210, partial [Conexivisphaerales archaeon]